MKRCKYSSRQIATAFVTAAVVAVAGSVFAQTVDDVLAAVYFSGTSAPVPASFAA